MHRADPYASRPSPRRRGRHDPLPPRGGPAGTLLTPPLDPGPAPWTPRRARVTIREIPGSALPRRARYHVHPLDVITLVLGIAVLLAILWQR